ncbi:SGNH/GDSL hydrolase family protein [Actinoplanes sp. LDG1-06]|uniref:SGNH/GDSL hydrolase family protein n=1 Tax=Paractinoplanes ovalisporus TaxID=2810368 RepID=A0ABS2A9Q9_9ACTN|nr:SGNH/GDSL hydrolase family protein [Actinoplanes ovalisporus]MBM2616562.1 SGNH/GDSL hydrolase family protein [Actinoplanes ovalisporus]
MRLTALLTASAVAAGTGILIALPAQAEGTGAAYVALGDSYASGEGAPESHYLEGDSIAKDGVTTGCHRAYSSWAFGVAATVQPADGILAACSGARATHLFGPNDSYPTTESAQIDEVGSSTRLVTLSIGGNDVGFADVVRGCVSAPGKRGRYDCRLEGRPVHDDAVRNLNKLTNLGVDTPNGPMTLAGIYHAVAERMAPDGVLVVANYPQLFSESIEGYRDEEYSCKVGTAYGVATATVKYDDALWMNSLAQEGNAAIANGVAEANRTLQEAGNTQSVVLADVDTAFEGHRICGGDKWINGAQLAGATPKQTSMHPSVKGQEAYCRAVTAALPGSPAPRCDFDQATQSYN